VGPGFYVRTLAEYAGGIAQMMKSAHACKAFGLNYEIHSYGPILSLAMYLNVVLAVQNCSFAEIMVPQNLLSMGMLNADLPIVDSEGFIGAPHKPVLGYDIDREPWRTLPCSGSESCRQVFPQIQAIGRAWDHQPQVDGGELLDTKSGHGAADVQRLQLPTGHHGHIAAAALPPCTWSASFSTASRRLGTVNGSITRGPKRPWVSST
jgi:hypothetical protein